MDVGRVSGEGREQAPVRAERNPADHVEDGETVEHGGRAHVQGWDSWD